MMLCSSMAGASKSLKLDRGIMNGPGRVKGEEVHGWMDEERYDGGVSWLEKCRMETVL
jgi:hypothetical protein